ncbi:hypothetical protein KI387_008643, partial [Taxus chinensis]
STSSSCESPPKESKGEAKEVDSNGVLKLKGNKIPKGLVSLKELFDRHDRFVKDRDKEYPRNTADFEK